MKKIKNPLIISIIFAAVLISGSLIFLGLQLGKSGSSVSQEAIEKGIESYIQKQQAAQSDTQKNQEKAMADKAKNVPAANDKDHIRGKKDALISLIEYSDYECPFCKKFHPTAQALLDKYPDTVNWIYRHFPLSFHDPLATDQAEASECAAELGGNDAFWKFTDIVYATTRSNGRGMEDEALVTIAVELGLNKDAFIACRKSDKYIGRVQQDIAEGAAAGITGTPGNILRNNKTGEVIFIPGAYPITALEQAVNQLSK